jgi:hypothetical protein
MRDTEIDNSLLEIARTFRPRILVGADRIEASHRKISREPRNILTARIGYPNAPRGRTDRSEPGAPIEKAICG